MSRISAMMDSGKRAMMSSQTSLQTVSHNIANKSTEGFSRQRVEQVTNTPVEVGGLRIGMGARAATISRINNPYLEKQIQKEGAHLGYLEGRSDSLNRVEQVYNEQMNKGLNSYISDFFNAVRELSNNPESLATRTMVRESADNMTKDFKRVASQLESVQMDLDAEVKAHVQAINQISKEIAQLNEKVASVEIVGAAANDERDRRDLLIKKLAELIDIHVADGENGMIAVTAGRSAVLVSGFTAMDLSAAKVGEKGREEIFYNNSAVSTPVRVTQELKGGKIGAVIEIRDKQINEMKDKIDFMAFRLATEVNRAHSQGVDRHGKPGGDFFEQPVAMKDCALDFKLAAGIERDVGQIVTGIAPNAPSDNTIANIISSLQFKPIMDGTQTTLDDYYNSVVGQMGIITQRANSAKEAQENILSQLKNIRESISGVSLDEETTKMIEFQKTFDASARLVRAADEMFDTVLSLKRM